MAAYVRVGGGRGFDEASNHWVEMVAADRMYFGDHNPPHFHVEFQGEKATFTFDGQIRSGNISSGTARKLVRDWARRHRLERMINWKSIEEGRPLNRIKPLE